MGLLLRLRVSPSPPKGSSVSTPHHDTRGGSATRPRTDVHPDHHNDTSEEAPVLRPSVSYWRLKKNWPVRVGDGGVRPASTWRPVTRDHTNETRNELVPKTRPSRWGGRWGSRTTGADEGCSGQDGRDRVRKRDLLTGDTVDRSKRRRKFRAEASGRVSDRRSPRSGEEPI